MAVVQRRERGRPEFGQGVATNSALPIGGEFSLCTNMNSPLPFGASYWDYLPDLVKDKIYREVHKQALRKVHKELEEYFWPDGHYRSANCGDFKIYAEDEEWCDPEWCFIHHDFVEVEPNDEEFCPLFAPEYFASLAEQAEYDPHNVILLA